MVTGRRSSPDGYRNNPASMGRKRRHDEGPDTSRKRPIGNVTADDPSRTNREGLVAVAFGKWTGALPAAKSHVRTQPSFNGRAPSTFPTSLADRYTSRETRRASRAVSPERSAHQSREASRDPSDAPKPRSEQGDSNDSQYTRSSGASAAFLEKLMVSMVRHGELLQEESVLTALPPDADDKSCWIQRRKVWHKRQAQDKRMADLYESADVDRLHTINTFRRMGDDFIVRLARNIRGQQRLIANEQVVDANGAFIRGKISQVDRIRSTRAGIVIGMRYDELHILADSTRVLADARQLVLDTEAKLVEREWKSEKLRGVQRRQEAELYDLARPFLVREGLLDSDDSTTLRSSQVEGNSQKVRMPAPDSQGSNVDSALPRVSSARQPMTERPDERDGEQDATKTTKEKPQARSVNDGIRANALNEYETAREDLFKDREELEKSHETNKRRKIQFGEGVRAGTVRGTPSDYDRFLYLSGRDLTENLRRSEERFKYAKTRAAEVGVLPKDQSSDFGQYPEDRDLRAENQNHKKAADFDGTYVETWRADVNGMDRGEMYDPEQPRGASEEPELDDFPAPSLEPGDSLFRFAAGKTRDKIDMYGAGGRGEEERRWVPGRGHCNSEGKWE